MAVDKSVNQVAVPRPMPAPPELARHDTQACEPGGTPYWMIGTQTPELFFTAAAGK